MTQFGLWLLPLVIGAIFGVVACIRGGLRWTWGFLIQHLLVGAVGVAGFFFSPDWLFAGVGWLLFVLFNIVRRVLMNNISTDLSLVRLEKARAAARKLRLISWGPPGRFWNDLIDLVEAHTFKDAARVESLLRKWTEPWVPSQTVDSLIAYSMLGQMLGRDWHGIINSYERCRSRYRSDLDSHKRVKFPTQAALAASRAYLEVGRVEESIECLESADIAGNMFAPDTVGTLFLSFFALLGDRAEVEAVLKRIASVKVLPEHARAFWQGRCELAGGNFDQAIALYEKSLAGLPAADTAWRDRLTHQLEQAKLARDTGALPWQMQPESQAIRASAISRGRKILDRSLLVSEIVSPTKRGPAIQVLAVVLSSIYLCQCLAAFNLSAALTGFWNWVFFKGVLDPQAVMHGEVWRVASYLFLHANLSHVLMNVLGLVWLGTHVEKVYGTSKFLVIYMISGIFSGITQVVLAPAQLAVGASGAVLGVFGASAAATFRLKDILPPAVRRYELTWMISLALLQLLFDQIVNFAFRIQHGSEDAVWIASAAHAGGMASGFILGLCLPLAGFIRAARLDQAKNVS